jgi:sigma54-dependent transcription regulator
LLASTARKHNPREKTRVIILFGGRSEEHEVSLLSARNVFLALDRDRFEPWLVGIDKRATRTATACHWSPRFPESATTAQPVDVRFVAATRRDPGAAGAAGRLRADLFLRLDGVHINLAPLRTRPDEILPAAESFLDQLAWREGIAPPRSSPSGRGGSSSNIPGPEPFTSYATWWNGPE